MSSGKTVPTLSPLRELILRPGWGGGYRGEAVGYQNREQGWGGRPGRPARPGPARPSPAWPCLPCPAQPSPAQGWGGDGWVDGSCHVHNRGGGPGPRAKHPGGPCGQLGFGGLAYDFGCRLWNTLRFIR
jgi:hypothetical protein